MIRQEIAKSVEKAIKELQKDKTLPAFDVPEIRIEKTEIKNHGDYSTNIAMIMAKSVREKPILIAERLKYKIQNIKYKILDRVELVQPGFINFFISDEYLQKQVSEILNQKEKFGKLKIGKSKKLQVEFISANPTGPLTVGNARGGPFGDTLANVLEMAGFKVEKAYYINDYGMQILALGHSVLKDSEAVYKGDYIEYLNAKIKSKDPYEAGQEAASIIINEMIKKTVKRFGVDYDEWFSEAILHESKAIDKAIYFLKGKKLTFEEDGALWFKSTDFGDQRDRVLIKQDGQKTYLAGDIAYHKYKFETKKFDKVIDIWGADHHGDVPGLQAAIDALGYKGKLDIILLQFVTLFENKEKLRMSKREGRYVTLDELLDKVGSDVFRFFSLQKSADTHLNFDLALAQEQSEKNPVYYVQYAHARICSILQKSNAEYKIPQRRESALRGRQDAKYELLQHPSELELIKQLTRLPEIVEDTAQDYQVQRIPQYALGLAESFHRFYHDCRVISDDKKLTEARLALVSATKVALENTLALMGISAPEKM